MGRETANVTVVLVVCLSSESSHISCWREMIPCCSHSTLYAMCSDRKAVALVNLIFPLKGCSPLGFAFPDVTVMSAEELGLAVSDVGFFYVL